MNIIVEQIAHHRNGIGGAPFYVVLFSEPDEERRMMAVVFESPDHVAVFNRSLLGRDVIAFAENSWRGDRYEADLRTAIQAAHAAGYDPTLAMRGLMYEREPS